MKKVFRIRLCCSQSDNPKLAIQNPKWVGIIALVITFAMCGVEVRAQQPAKIPRIGYLGSIPLSAFATRKEAFLQGLRELGYVEGKTIVIEWRSAEGHLDRLPALAAELVRLKVDIIVSASPTTTRSIKDATSTIPIIMAQDSDPVASGFAASLAHPGGNVTGLSTLLPEISGKRVEILKEIVPRLARIAVLGASTTPGTLQSLKETELAAGAFKVQLHFLDILEPTDIEIAFRAAAKERADAVLVLGGPFILSNRTDCRTRGKEPDPGDILLDRICGGRGAYQLRRELC
jgi:ABC-type uncharacterized transport system substrate-binding protein